MPHKHPVRRVHPEPADSFVLVRVSWVMLGLGAIAAVLFSMEPDVRTHPGLLLLGITGLVGTGVLRLLAHLLRTPPQRSSDGDDASR